MRVRYTPRARSDLKAIYDYITQRHARGAQRVKASIKRTAAGLCDMPGLGRQTPRPSVRVIGVPRYPYLIYYRIVGGEVHIIHVRHGARDVPTPEELENNGA